MRLMTQAYAIGAVDYLIKPLDPDAVNAKVAVFVDLQRKAEQIRTQEERLRALDRERNAEALRESEVLYEATFNQAPVGIAHLSPDGRWQRVNERFCAMLGRTAGELLGHDLADVVFPDDVAGAARRARPHGRRARRRRTARSCGSFRRAPRRSGWR